MMNWALHMVTWNFPKMERNPWSGKFITCFRSPVFTAWLKPFHIISITQQTPAHHPLSAMYSICLDADTCSGVQSMSTCGDTITSSFPDWKSHTTPCSELLSSPGSSIGAKFHCALNWHTHTHKHMHTLSSVFLSIPRATRWLQAISLSDDRGATVTPAST